MWHSYINVIETLATTFVSLATLTKKLKLEKESLIETVAIKWMKYRFKVFLKQNQLSKKEEHYHLKETRKLKKDWANKTDAEMIICRLSLSYRRKLTAIVSVCC